MTRDRCAAEMGMNIKWLVGFVVCVTVVFYHFVYGQWYLVSSTWLFIVMVLLFVSLSFYCSATETAFSSAHTDNRIQSALAADAAAIAKRYDDFQKIIESVGLASLDTQQKKSLRRIDRDNEILKRKSSSLDQSSRSVYVGTFASLSVFLNIALAASLPLALTISSVNVEPIGFNVPYPLFSETSVSLAWKSLDLSGQKTLVFFASAFPILVFGKVVPKEVGALFNMFYAYRLNALARGLVIAFGFIPKAMSGPLLAIRRYSERRKS